MLGPPFNPNYAQNCTPTTPELCELGDVTGKHDTLTVAGEILKAMIVINTHDSIFYTSS